MAVEEVESQGIKGYGSRLNHEAVVSFDPTSYGMREIESENIELALPYQENEKYNTGPWNEPLHLIRRALSIRSAIEWVAWTRQTIYPGDMDRYQPGEAQGQCMVTARFAKPYFPGSRITEVQVKKEDGTTAGPHIVLNLNNDKQEPIYLDLSPDQEDAVGYLPRTVTEANPFKKIGYTTVNSPESPYIFTRFQTDDELATKKSLPLEHTRLLWEMMSYRYPQPQVHRIQRFADSQPLESVEAIVADHPPILARTLAIKSRLEPDQQIQAGVINKSNFLPSPDWIWKATGLNGLDTVVIEDRGHVKQVITYNGEQIVHLNLRGYFTQNQLAGIKNEIMPNPQEHEALFYPNLLEQQIYSSGITGPIFVNRVG
jgi:hypothetical protein